MKLKRLNEMKKSDVVFFNSKKYAYKDAVIEVEWNGRTYSYSSETHPKIRGTEMKTVSDVLYWVKDDYAENYAK